MNFIDPYQAIGLRRNPFIVSESLEIPSQYWIDFGYSIAPPIKAKLMVQIIGQKGAGKTSHLLHWRKQTGGTYYCCPKGWQSWQIPPVGGISYWDEADRIPLPLLLYSLSQAASKKATIVVGTHADLSYYARIAGLRVKTIHLATLCLETVLQWAQKRIEAESLTPEIAPQLQLNPTLAAEIVAKSQGSWRMAANHLHIWTATLAQEELLRRS